MFYSIDSSLKLLKNTRVQHKTSQSCKYFLIINIMRANMDTAIKRHRKGTWRGEDRLLFEQKTSEPPRLQKHRSSAGLKQCVCVWVNFWYFSAEREEIEVCV